MKNLLIGGVISAASFVGLSCEPATIGGTEVPAGLHCEEDEVIAPVAVDTLGCVHREVIAAEEAEAAARRAERLVND